MLTMWFPFWPPRLRSRSGSRPFAGSSHGTARLMLEELEGRVLLSGNLPGTSIESDLDNNDVKSLLNTLGFPFSTFLQASGAEQDLGLGWHLVDPNNPFREITGTVLESRVS